MQESLFNGYLAPSIYADVPGPELQVEWNRLDAEANATLRAMAIEADPELRAAMLEDVSACQKALYEIEYELASRGLFTR